MNRTFKKTLIQIASAEHAPTCKTKNAPVDECPCYRPAELASKALGIRPPWDRSDSEHARLLKGRVPNDEPGSAHKRAVEAARIERTSAGEPMPPLAEHTSTPRRMTPAEIATVADLALPSDLIGKAANESLARDGERFSTAVIHKAAGKAPKGDPFIGHHDRKCERDRGSDTRHCVGRTSEAELELRKLTHLEMVVMFTQARTELKIEGIEKLEGDLSRVFNHVAQQAYEHGLQTNVGELTPERRCNQSAANDRTCPRCGSQLVNVATPAEQTPTPGRIDRHMCPSATCDFWVDLPELERLNLRAELRRRELSTDAPILITAAELEAVMRKGLPPAELEAISHASIYSGQEIKRVHDFLRRLIEAATQLASSFNYTLDHAAHFLGHVAVNEILSRRTMNSELHLAELGMMRDQIAADVAKLAEELQGGGVDPKYPTSERTAGAWLALKGVLGEQVEPMLEGWPKNEPQSRAAEIILNGEKPEPA